MSKIREIGIVTSSRADWGILLPVVRAVARHPELEARVLATGMHLSAEFGSTVSLIEQDGVEIYAAIPSMGSSDSAAAIGRSIGRGTIGFADLFQRWKPDILLVTGDRFDMLPAGLAALPQRVPVAHLHGGETTEGAMDESIRHSLTKMAHIHFAATAEYAHRIIQMGEEPWRVSVTGAPGLDNFRRRAPADRHETAKRFGFDPERRLCLVTYHPVTLESQHVKQRIEGLLEALGARDLEFVFTGTNADTHGSIIARAIQRFADGRPHVHLVQNAGQQGYLSLLAAAELMVGNSSSGIIEAASFALPVVNVGIRQRGRIRGANVLDCGPESDSIAAAITKALSPDFVSSLRGMTNPYGDGRSAPRIATVLAETALDQRLLVKRFYPAPPA